MFFTFSIFSLYFYQVAGGVKYSFSWNSKKLYKFSSTFEDIWTL